MKIKSYHTFLLLCYFIQVGAVAQTHQSQPIKWTFTTVPLSKGEAKLIFTCNLEDDWHIYSQFLEEGGPLPTSFTFTPDRSYTLEGKVVEESTPIKEIDNVFMMPIVWFKETAVFSQRVKLHDSATTIQGKIEFMGCNSFMCMPPNEISFSLEVKGKDQKHSKSE